MFEKSPFYLRFRILCFFFFPLYSCVPLTCFDLRHQRTMIDSCPSSNLNLVAKHKYKLINLSSSRIISGPESNHEPPNSKPARENHHPTEDTSSKTLDSLCTVFISRNNDGKHLFPLFFSLLILLLLVLLLLVLLLLLLFLFLLLFFLLFFSSYYSSSSSSCSSTSSSSSLSLSSSSSSSPVSSYFYFLVLVVLVVVVVVVVVVVIVLVVFLKLSAWCSFPIV
jgi:hypothetical protein